MDDQLILFTECANLNSDYCLYTKKPEQILSILNDPQKCLPNESKIQELNNQCFDCAWYLKK